MSNKVACIHGFLPNHTASCLTHCMCCSQGCWRADVHAIVASVKASLQSYSADIHKIILPKNDPNKDRSSDRLVMVSMLNDDADACSVPELEVDDETCGICGGIPMASVVFSKTEKGFKCCSSCASVVGSKLMFLFG